MGCVVCEKIAEKKAVIIYEDEFAVAVLPARPASLGHVKVFSRKHATKLEELPDEDVERVMLVASISSAACFDVMKAHGTNILLTESDSHLVLDIVPRKEDDKLDFSWKPKEGNPAELDDIASKIRDKAFVVGKKEKKPEVIVVPEEKAVAGLKEPQKQETTAPDVKSDKSDASASSGKPDSGDEPVNYLIKNLERIP